LPALSEPPTPVSGRRAETLGLLNKVTLHTTQHRRNMNWVLAVIFLIAMVAACWLLTGAS
jgi:hypothetical protein